MSKCIKRVLKNNKRIFEDNIIDEILDRGMFNKSTTNEFKKG